MNPSDPRHTNRATPSEASAEEHLSPGRFVDTHVLEAILDTAVDGIVTINTRGQIISVNRATETIFGYSARELLGQNVSMLMPSPYRDEHDAYLDRYQKTGERKIIGIGRQVAGRRKDGNEFPLELAVAEVRIDGTSIFTGMLRDISRRVEAERRLREQAELIDLSPDAIMVRDEQDRILFWSQGAERLYGWGAGEALGQDVRTLLSIPPDSHCLSAGRDRDALSHTWRGRLRLKRKDGHRIDVESRCVLVPAEAGHPMRRLVIDSDLSEQKRLEARLMRSQRLESVGTLAGGIAHDLNNVLTPITVAAQLLAMNRAGADVSGLVKMIQASAARGAEMIKQLLSFAGGNAEDRVPTRLTEVIRGLRVILEHTLPKSIRLVVSVCANPWTVVGDITELTQVLMNLSVNARDAMPQGGTLTITVENMMISDDELHYPGAKPGPYVALTVSDTGHGMTPEVLERIFDPFFTTKEQGKGTGLGLSTTMGIVRRYGGMINVYSEPGQGTRFFVHLPAQLSEDDLQRPAAVRTLPRGDGQLVLVVDDEPLILRATQAALESYGYRVLTASNGSEAIEIVRQHRDELAVAIVDMMMPRMDGIVTMGNLARNAPNLPLIAASGLHTPAKAQEAMAAGARMFLQKPFSPDSLRMAIDDVLKPSA